MSLEISSIATIKKELAHLAPQELMALTLRLIKYKKENKELSHYVLFEQNNEQQYIQSIKDDVDEHFAGINTGSLFWAKKSIRKILRIITKYGNYSGLPITNIELLIHFCQSFNTIDIDLHQSAAMTNLYSSQLKKIDNYIATLHEDLQFDYRQRIKALEK